MANQTQKIRIESVLGGHSGNTYFSAPDQFLTSQGIDPSLAGEPGDIQWDTRPSGLIRPTPSSKITGDVSDTPRWIVGSPSGAGSDFNSFLVYCGNGSIYSIDADLSVVTGLGDLNDGGTASGNGSAYYDNYIYFSRDTTVARYGPLDGSETFTDDYWVGTLGKTALIDTAYPKENQTNDEYPNHYLHRHSDGKLYIADVVGNQGTIHYIKTTKTTVEGDTDAGSTYGALSVGYKLWPTCMESYGDFLVIAFVESNGGGVNNLGRDSFVNAKVAFWDTTSPNVSKIIWREYPDSVISAIKNVNGVLYFFSGPIGVIGARVMRLVGDYSFEDVLYLPESTSPFPGAVDSTASRVVFAGLIATPASITTRGTVYSLGLRGNQFGSGLFSIHRPAVSTDYVTAIKLHKNVDGGIGLDMPIVGYNINIDKPTGYGNSQNQWFSQVYKVGQPFKITKIRIPLYDFLTSSMSVSVYIEKDVDSGGGAQKLVGTINSANYGTTTKSIVIRPEDQMCDHSFSLGLVWTGTALCTVALPITIEYELLDVDSIKPYV